MPNEVVVSFFWNNLKAVIDAWTVIFSVPVIVLLVVAWAMKIWGDSAGD